ncbi:hypothetical protein JOC94_000289 [Bacillus thermophilus]|uniref:Uncharacterized protein n=1 Tax=Siminovitchia thermophila TaxID=1245522 RepID=A0ABS2R360_9BACI|nr:hypothetical protein [Siminovitchia thermophila]
MTKAISCLFAPLVTHRLLLEMVIVGEGVGGNQSLQLMMWTTGGERHAKSRDFKEGI